jgi:hypothetical protein
MRPAIFNLRELNMIRIYGIRERLNPIKATLSNVINQCMVDALSFPENKRAHRFFPMDPQDYFYDEAKLNYKVNV